MTVYVTCPVCDAPCDVRESKGKRPYWVCDTCGVQVFVRGAVGVEKLKEKLIREAKQDGK